MLNARFKEYGTEQLQDLLPGCNSQVEALVKELEDDQKITYVLIEDPVGHSIDLYFSAVALPRDGAAYMQMWQFRRPQSIEVPQLDPHTGKPTGKVETVRYAESTPYKTDISNQSKDLLLSVFYNAERAPALVKLAAYAEFLQFLSSDNPRAGELSREAQNSIQSIEDKDQRLVQEMNAPGIGVCQLSVLNRKRKELEYEAKKQLNNLQAVLKQEGFF